MDPASLHHGLEALSRNDPDLFNLLEAETRRQQRVLNMVAAASVTHSSVQLCQASSLGDVTTEGYPGRRFHAGCEVVDEIERLAVERARSVFGAEYANVQPHSGTSANLCLLFSLLKPGDTLLGMELSSGGHLTHGAPASVVGRVFRCFGYGLDREEELDYDQVADLAHRHRPRVIICGASAYPRQIDFQRFRALADEVGAYLIADISHTAGLVAAGLHPSPIDHAHFVTTSTYKQLFGPRGGLILMGRSHDAPAEDGSRLSELVQRAVFPLGQGTPNLSAIAAKARAFAFLQTPAFTSLAESIVTNARALANNLAQSGYRLVTGGTDTHMVLVDLSAQGITGKDAEEALESCGILVNRNRVPGDSRPATVASGIRLGTNCLASRGMGPPEMSMCAGWIDRVLLHLAHQGPVTQELRGEVSEGVGALCARFPHLSSWPTL